MQSKTQFLSLRVALYLRVNDLPSGILLASLVILRHEISWRKRTWQASGTLQLQCRSGV